MLLLRNKTYLVFSLSIVFMVFGLLIYANLRGENLILHRILKSLGIFDFLKLPNDWIILFNFPDWFLFALPDGLWMLSLGLLMAAIWNFTFHKLSIFWYACGLGLGILNEFLQIFQIVPGTFDWIDLLFILIGGLFPLLFFIKKATK